MKTEMLIPLLLIPLALAGCSDGGTEAADLALSPTLVRSGGPIGSAGLVSSAHETATVVGIEILEAGGNAFDAAVAIAATLTVVEPMNSNLFGGYGTLITYDSETGNLRYLDNNGRFPRAVNSDVFRPPANLREMMRTAKAVSTPGNLQGFEALWKEYGSMPWAELFDGAIAAAENGVTVYEGLAGSIARAWPVLSGYTKGIYGGVDGEPLESGDLLVQSDLAESFRIAARDGSAALQGGVLGEALVAEMERREGFLAMEDLVASRAEWFEPIRIDYRGYEVVTAGPPSNSFASLVSLGIMSRFDNAALGHNSAAYLHRFAEATKHAFWARLKYAGGPEVSPPPLDILLSPAYWQAQADAIDLESAATFVPPAGSGAEAEDTTHFVVADSEGNVVSATITLGDGFGSTVMVEGTGIWLNNSLAYSTFEPKGNPMDALPGNRKHSSKTPTMILRDGLPWVAIGTPGGHTIPQTTAQMVINLIDFEMDIQAAVDAGRVAFAEPQSLQVGDRVPEEIRAVLESMGHEIRTRRGIGRAHALLIERNVDGSPSRFLGAADSRGGGVAMGVDSPSSIPF